MAEAVVLMLVLSTSLTLVAGRSWTALIELAVVCGAAQAVLISIFKTNAFQLLDDVPVVVIAVVAVARLLSSRERRDHLALLAALVVVVLTAFAAVRSPDPSIAMAQARQVLLPVGLALAGFALRDIILWRRLWAVVLGVAVVTAVWMIIEEIVQGPLVDPVWYYTESVGGSFSSMRYGLPPAYFADIAGGVVFRPGGPFLNPPVAGFLLGAGSCAAMYLARGPARLFFLFLLGLAIVLATARAGILIFVIVTVVFTAWNRLGRTAALLISALFATYALSTFLEQGNTGSHAEGLVSGLMTALTEPLGLGFGVTGYQATLGGAEAGSGSESLFGLYFSWLGLPALVCVVLVAAGLVRQLSVIPRDESLGVWVAIATLTAAAYSESASSIASTPALWLAVGYALARPTVGANDSFRGTYGRGVRKEPVTT